MKQLNIQRIWHVNPGGASGTAGGLVMIWKNNLDVEILDCSINHINAKIHPTSGPPWLFTGYHGNSNNTQWKLNSWKVLEYTASKNSLPYWLLAALAALSLGQIREVSLLSLSRDSISSDHHPIFLNTNPHWSTGKIPFKFFGPWLDHKDCKDIIFECWQRNLSGSSALLIARKLKEVKLKLKIWNKEVYGNIKTNIEECKQHLHWLQENYFNQDRSKALQTAMKVLREWQDIEEKFWKIKSRDQYIKLGDKNTSYFHRTTKSRLRRNKIDTIQDSSGNWIENYQDIKKCFTNHFSKMATSESHSMNTEILNLIPTVITTEDNKNLNRIPEDREVKAILFIMAKDKAPGPDGFPPNFFQANWDIIGEDLVKMVQHFFKVDWKFLHTIMVKIGFNSEWCNKIMQCISTTSTAVLLNGYPDKFFNPTRGLWKGDPLSPYLFLFCMEALSRILSHAEDLGLISGENTIEAQNLKDILNIFGDTYGQLINFSKSGVFFSKDIDPALMPIICKLLGVQILPTNDKIPKKTCQDMNKLQRDFFWGKNLENPKGYYPKAWTTICKPKELGGIGFMNMELFNSAMVTKVGCRLEQDKDSLWYQLMDAKYLLGINVLSMNTKAKDGDSWIWKGVLEGIQNIQQHCEWRIGNGNKIKNLGGLLDTYFN
ncbi:uncharacterized protein LOC113335702 [Papaver somniferum]|uniref:uncharacterized protein LOC113335702 n=1 Tax=Papaver somniferum TaxID=3469 RepID=UPI000E6F5359|nr:uncharacterized protein LOC113335702 [Papaver somniferum]